LWGKLLIIVIIVIVIWPGHVLTLTPPIWSYSSCLLLQLLCLSLSFFTFLLHITFHALALSFG